MQAAGDGVGLTVELAAGVQRGHDDFNGRPVLHRVVVHRDAAAVVPYAHAAVRQQRYFDPVAVSRQRLVDSVIYDLLDKVMQSALARGADIHARALADSF